ncbi:MAG: hypothetical protein KGI41_03520 [Patescibacteria group bacterium]|nr:hypothetical protein [Patescibacteria group bacterium]MDE1966280.1 hypothetical protein [Patescibacteria group bacterium]
MLHPSLIFAGAPPDNPQSDAELSRYARYTLTPIDHDYPGKTPAMWNALYRAFGMDAAMAMVVGSPASVGDIVDSFRRDPKYAGGGSGSGFKECVLPHLDGATPLAKAIGAVNIIRREADGRLVGDNTDGIGYAESLASALLAVGKKLLGAQVLMLGAGGTGRAIAFALADASAHVHILNRTESKARELADAVNAHFHRGIAEGGGRERIGELLPKMDAVVSVIDDAASPLDEYSTIGDMALPVTDASVTENRKSAAELLASANASLIVSDVRLRAGETAMLRQARELGFPTQDGAPMVVNQGVRAFRFVHGDEIAGRTDEEIARIMREAAS